jgi:four helix bundle protein
MQNSKCKLQNVRDKRLQPHNLSGRLMNFAVSIIKMIEQINRDFVGREIARQLIRAWTSAGANYEEACGAESRSDFIHKLQIALKELKETIYWLRLISRLELISPEEIESLLKEAMELANIIGKSILPAKKNRAEK